ncbi:MAG: hypothetical protein HYU38_10140 [Candidatus Tectomicrobia bacterium]|nr:hypothetical protein [Candidatus Tectomicrobia bacterium]
MLAGLRAAAYGIPFQPIRGFRGSDIPERSGILPIEDPYTGETLFAVPALRPDWALIHVQRADAEGNAWILGNRHFDVEMTRAAARGVILTAEEIVPGEEIARDPGMTAIPGFLVRAVAEAPGGAWPCSCHPAYGVDEEGMRRYMELSASAEGLERYLRETAPKAAAR